VRRAAAVKVAAVPVKVTAAAWRSTVEQERDARQQRADDAGRAVAVLARQLSCEARQVADRLVYAVGTRRNVSAGALAGVGRALAIARGEVAVLRARLQVEQARADRRTAYGADARQADREARARAYAARTREAQA